MATEKVRRTQMHCPWPRTSVSNTRARRAEERPAIFSDEPTTHPRSLAPRVAPSCSDTAVGRARKEKQPGRARRTQPQPFVRESTHDLLGR